MFFRGVFLGDQNTVVVCIKKFQKNVKKHYFLLDIQTQAVPFQNQNLVDDISAFYNNPEYIIKKRIYSQDGRPTKTVSANPGVVIGFYGDKGCWLADQLRSKNVRVEIVSVSQDRETLKSEEYNRGLGRNFYLQQAELFQKLSVVMVQNRLIVDPEKLSENDNLQLISTLLAKSNHQIEDISENIGINMDMRIALSLPIWFRETVRYTRAYSA